MLLAQLVLVVLLALLVLLALEVLVDGTFNVVEAAATHRVAKLVAASSASVPARSTRRAARWRPALV